MSGAADFLAVRGDRVKIKTLVSLIFIAWAFGFACRLAWIWIFADERGFYWLGQLMINTNDGYFWAEGARDLLERPDKIDELSPVTRGLPIITAALAKCLPFISFETLILYMPAALGSLLVAPIILIGHALGRVAVGFVAALIAVVAWSYYNRTMIGYYDDDMLVLVLPAFVLYALIAGVCSKKTIYPPLSAIFAFVSVWYYQNSQLLIFGASFMLFIYAAATHIRAVTGREDANEAAYLYKLLFFLLLGVIAQSFGLIGAAALFVVITAFVIFQKAFDRPSILAPLAAVAMIASLYLTGAIVGFWHQFSGYIVREATSVAEDPNATILHFFNVAQTVREAGGIPFGEFAARISGATVAFFLALIGTIAAAIRYKVLLFALPFVGLGFMAYGIPGLIGGGGLRFTIYAVPALAFGLSYLIFWVASRAANNLAYYAVAAVLSAAALLPHLAHIYEYRTPTVFYSYEVEALDQFKQKIAAREDYAISWWDYGYPIRYYSYAKTLADGGKHGGADNFAPSFILSTNDQKAAAKMARLAVEYTEKQIAENNYSSSILGRALVDYGESDPDRFVRNLGEHNLSLPAKTREIYLALPMRMGEVFGTVMRFSSLELSSGRQYEPPFFIGAYAISNQDNRLTLANGIVIDVNEGVARIGAQSAPIKSFYMIGYEQNGKFVKREQKLRRDGRHSVIVNANTGNVWIADDRALGSVFVQLFALENYDPALFEPVVITPMMKIYRILI
ncbi:MAG: peptide transporter [Helicobacteraceae bacterium]|jgi:dolichyl-diphosphooligosaccharide--protein glycosyltransferase/undecaprenyl-diphosphooligosaccharide--protein glycosyltransferase|nr:peptide transporter [Helicobacteraceae bacterium]